MSDKPAPTKEEIREAVDILLQAGREGKLTDAHRVVLCGILEEHQDFRVNSPAENRWDFDDECDE